MFILVLYIDEQSLMKRIPDLTTVEESVNEMIQITLSIISSYQQQVFFYSCLYTQIEWLFSIGLNTSSIDTILFTTDDILAIFDIVKYDMKENVYVFSLLINSVI